MNGYAAIVFIRVLVVGFVYLLVNIGEFRQAQLAQSLLEMKDAKGRMDSADDALRKAPFCQAVWAGALTC